MIYFQGLEDEVVPPSQAEKMFEGDFYARVFGFDPVEPIHIENLDTR